MSFSDILGKELRDTRGVCVCVPQALQEQVSSLISVIKCVSLMTITGAVCLQVFAGNRCV